MASTKSYPTTSLPDGTIRNSHPVFKPPKPQFYRFGRRWRPARRKVSRRDNGLLITGGRRSARGGRVRKSPIVPRTGELARNGVFTSSRWVVISTHLCRNGAGVIITVMVIGHLFGGWRTPLIVLGPTWTGERRRERRLRGTDALRTSRYRPIGFIGAVTYENKRGRRWNKGYMSAGFDTTTQWKSELFLKPLNIAANEWARSERKANVFGYK